MSTETETLEKVETDTNTGDHDLFSHYAKKEAITESAVTGEPIQAICGKFWTPRFADGSKFPVCPACKEIYAVMQG